MRSLTEIAEPHTERINEILEDLQGIIFDYQVCPSPEDPYRSLHAKKVKQQTETDNKQRCEIVGAFLSLETDGITFLQDPGQSLKISSILNGAHLT